MILKSGMTDDEIRAECDGTTDEDCSVLIPLEALNRLGIKVHPKFHEGESAWVQVALVRSKL